MSHGLGERKNGTVAADRDAVSFWGDENILKLIVVIVENKLTKKERSKKYHPKSPKMEEAFFNISTNSLLFITFMLFLVCRLREHKMTKKLLQILKPFNRLAVSQSQQTASTKN